MTGTQEDNLYRKNAGIVLINETGHIFVAERSDIKGAWQMPQGGMDSGEDSLAAARRELFEETSIKQDDVELIAIHPDWLKYDFPKKKKNDDFIGQQQKWFLFRFKGDESKIDVLGAKDAEFSAWKWVGSDEILDVVWEVRTPVYAEVFKYFSRYLSHTGMEEEEDLLEEDFSALLDDESDEDESKA